MLCECCVNLDISFFFTQDSRQHSDRIHTVFPATFSQDSHGIPVRSVGGGHIRRSPVDSKNVDGGEAGGRVTSRGAGQSQHPTSHHAPPPPKEPAQSPSTTEQFHGTFGRLSWRQAGGGRGKVGAPAPIRRPPPPQPTQSPIEMKSNWPGLALLPPGLVSIHFVSKVRINND